MSLSVELAIEKTTLLLQENPVCRLTVVNNGDRPLKVASPGGSPDVPTLRVTELKTGIETLQHKPVGQTGTAYQDLGPGKKIEYEFRLNSIARLTLPVDYEVGAVLYYDLGAHHAESKPVHLRLIPVTPRDLTWVYGQGGWSSVLFGVAVNAASDQPQLVRYEFEIQAAGGVVDARPVANVPLRASPMLSAPPNNSVTSSHWILWQEGKSICFTHFDAALGPLPVGKWQPPEPEFLMVGPAASSAAGDPAARPPGAILLWVGDAGRRFSAFQTLELTPAGQAQPAARCEAGDSCPRWMMSHTRSDGRRFVTYVSDTAKGSSFYFRPWPSAGAAGEARLLAEWTSHCVGGGAVLVSDDTIYGAALLRSHEREGAKLELALWRIGPKGEFVPRERIDIPWGYLTPVDKAIVRINTDGKPAALLADGQGQWHLLDVDGKLKAPPAEVSRARFPLDLAFLDGTDVVIIAAQPGTGFKVMMANGDPLPQPHG